MNRKDRPSIVMGILAVSGLVSALAFSATPSRAEPPPQAQEAMKKGLIAAQQQDYPQAVGHFKDALKVAPGDPEILGDLGLAESKISGHELLSICWFAAYLAADPKAPNAAAVKDEIRVLQVRIATANGHLIELAKTVGGAIPLPSYLNGPGDSAEAQYLPQIAFLYALSGDMPAAKAIAQQPNKDPNFRITVLRHTTDGASEAWDFSSAKSLIPQLQADDDKFNRLNFLSHNQALAGDLTGLHETIDQMQSMIAAGFTGNDVNLSRLNLAEAQAEAGEIGGARKTLALVSETFAASKATIEAKIAQAASKSSVAGTTSLLAAVSQWTNEIAYIEANQPDIAEDIKTLPAELKTMGANIKRDPYSTFNLLADHIEFFLDDQRDVYGMLKRQGVVE